jgi:hypothetical protein
MDDGTALTSVADPVEPDHKKKAPPNRGGTNEVYWPLGACQIKPNIAACASEPAGGTADRVRKDSSPGD